MIRRLVLLFVIVALQTSSVNGEGIGPEFLVRLDLQNRSQFERMAQLNFEPVYRWGNEFYFVLDGADLALVGTRGLQYTSVDSDPFTDCHYYVDAKSPFMEFTQLGKLGDLALDQIGGATLWKSDKALGLYEFLGGDAPYEITRESIPLIYMEPQTAAGTAVDAPILDTIVARILQDSLLAYDTRLMDFQTRYVYTDSNDAAQAYIRNKFLSYGYTDVKYDTFYTSGWPAHNVICTKLGTTQPDKIVLIGAHYDSWNGQSDAFVFAPGADDNGSGTGAVMEIARVLADLPTRKTIVFMAFDAEEIGLVGSDFHAGRMLSAGADLELMLNMDMISYEPNSYWNVEVNTNPASVAYAQLAAQFASDKTSLEPTIITSAGGSSDHYPFGQRGYHFVYAAEGDFNTGGWHTNIDLVSRNNFPYYTDVVRMMGLMTYVTAQSPAPVSATELWDIGDGQALEVRWTASPDPDITGYNVCLGTSPGVYTDTVPVAGNTTESAALNGLTEGTVYYVSVAAVAANGWESITRTEMNLAPQSMPRAPGDLTENIELSRIELSWDASVELDFDHFEVYRGTDSTSLTLYEASVPANFYADYGATNGVRFYYRVVAVDNLANTGPQSNMVSGIAAYFDQDILIFDVTGHTSGDPTEANQLLVYNQIFGGYQHGYYKYDSYAVPIDKSELGQYRTVFWIDDDIAREVWPADHWAKLNWYMSYGNNVVITGWATPNEMASSNVLLDEFGVSDDTRIDVVDCVGGIGEAGFPNVIFDTARVYPTWNGVFGWIYTMTPANGTTETILRYNSSTDNASRETLVVGIRRNTGMNRLGLVSLPLYYLRNADAAALVAAFASWFGQAPAATGDINGDAVIDVIDVALAIDVVFSGVSPPTGYVRVDVNADCIVTVLDLVYLIDYVYRGGPAPLDGCAY